ncbi:hypothetical protein K1T71_014813 [Dendrolimus kikuchii]|nr:hypothetical protein K1T71_014813 [Dendrolimus kikuchii]
MALCESKLEMSLSHLKREESSPGSEESQKESPEKKPKLEHNGDLYGLDKGMVYMSSVPGGLPLSVDYRSPVSHFVPPAIELYAARHKPEQITSAESSSTPPPMKRKRGRPRVDKTSPEYLANLAARKQAKEMAAMMNNRPSSDTGEKRKRGRPRVDKTSPEYLARKRARELEAMERKTKRENKRRSTAANPITRAQLKLPARLASKVQDKKIALPSRKGTQKMNAAVRKVGDKKVLVRRNSKFLKRKESAASSSTGDTTPRMKRKYTRRTISAKKDVDGVQRHSPCVIKKRPRKIDQMANSKQPQQAKIRVRSNLMPDNTEPISLDSDDEPDLGRERFPRTGGALSSCPCIKARGHVWSAPATGPSDDMFEAHLLAANFKKPSHESGLRANRDDDEVLSIRSSEGCASVKEMDTRVEKLEDSSNSDSDSSSSGSGSSSSGSSSSSSDCSSSSDSSDSDSDSGDEKTANNDAQPTNNTNEDERIHRRSHQNRGGGNSRSRTRFSDRYECDCCNETFNRREKLWEHKAEAHRGSMTVRCEVCRKCFEDDAELAAHDRTHTDDERAGRCAECGASFLRYDQLRKHLACAHGASGVQNSTGSANSKLPHACAQCGKRFGHAHSLTRHLHNHAKQLYRCVVCKASFARADQLAQHLNSHLANYKRYKP